MHRPTWAEINLSALRHNLLEIKKHIGPKVKILGVVKANAYGHGDYEVSTLLVKNGVEMLGIALVEEGIRLREKGITSPLLLFGGFFEEQIDAIIRYNLTPTIYDLKLAEKLANQAHCLGKIVKVHIYVDTGMGGIGVKYDNTFEFTKCLAEMNNLIIEGIYTHCSSSDDNNPAHTTLQIRKFKNILATIDKAGIIIPLKHMANTGSILRYNDSYFTMARPGLSLYGLYATDEESHNLPIKPVMSLKTRIIHIKTMEPGETLGYGGSCKITRSTRVATLPFGYDDGYNRLLSNQGMVLVRGNKVPVIGRICMDQCFIDVTSLKNVSVGDEVVVYGRQGKETISIESVAKQRKTIPYEITCNVSNRVPRIYIDEDYLSKSMSS
ncbi:MAG: alanine racemase [Candidatus Kuenenia sp.]|nr:alanine racemase [Candidatus Kuenenia hertensis]